MSYAARNFFFDGTTRYFGVLKPNFEENQMWYEKELDLKRDPILYKYNNEGFRCDDFKLEKEGMHLLFGGCSETEGAANKIEDVWANVVYQNIKKDNVVSGYYNVAKIGLTIGGVIMNVFQYMNDYGCPDYIFLQLPDHNRHLTWSDKLSKWKNITEEKGEGFYVKYPFGKKEAEYLKSKRPDADAEIGLEEEKSVMHVNMFYNYLLLRNLIQFCNMNKIKLIWSSWDPKTAVWLIDKLNTDEGYVDTTTLGEEHWGMKISDIKARDGIHVGPGFHKIWAKKFYEEFMNDQNIKKNNS